jgi:quercetin dioxygenase-like cupin family protein
VSNSPRRNNVDERRIVMPYEIVDAAEIEAVNGVFKPLRASLGVSAFGINQIELPPNAEGPEHDHGEDGQEEVYAIVGGRGTIWVEGETHDLRPGQFVFLAPGTSRKMVAGADGLAWIGIGCQPGAYRTE